MYIYIYIHIWHSWYAPAQPCPLTVSVSWPACSRDACWYAHLHHILTYPQRLHILLQLCCSCMHCCSSVAALLHVWHALIVLRRRRTVASMLILHTTQCGPSSVAVAYTCCNSVAVAYTCSSVAYILRNVCKQDTNINFLNIHISYHPCQLWGRTHFQEWQQWQSSAVPLPQRQLLADRETVQQQQDEQRWARQQQSLASAGSNIVPYYSACSILDVICYYISHTFLA